MAEKKKFLLRIDNDVYAALEKWASDELRSINAQIEFLLADALKKKKRDIKPADVDNKTDNSNEDNTQDEK
jgi:hypothetical protein